jgi:pimeloyl-ACP methyl ester carboxylesterase
MNALSKHPIPRTLAILFLLAALTPAAAAAAAAKTESVTAADVQIPTSDGLSLAGSYWGQPAKSHAVLLLHMYHSDRTAWSELAAHLAASGVSVLAIDFRGHGGSSKQGNRVITPEDIPDRDSKGFVTDATAGMAWLSEQPGVDAAHVGIVGASIGANAALLEGALDKRVRTVVLLSPGLDFHGLKTERAMEQYGTRPVFMLASEDDKYSADAVRRLATLARGRSAVKVFKKAGHGTHMFEVEPTLRAQISGWLKENL